MTGGARFRRAPTVLSRTVGSEVLLATPGRDHIRSLDGTAGAIWELMDEPCSVSDLAGLVADAYGMPASSIEDDIRHLLSALEEDGLVERTT